MLFCAAIESSSDIGKPLFDTRYPLKSTAFKIDSMRCNDALADCNPMAASEVSSWPEEVNDVSTCNNMRSLSAMQHHCKGNRKTLITLANVT